MRDLRTLDSFRVRLTGMPPIAGPLGGSFMIPYPSTGARLKVIASAVLSWDHVSVSLKNRCPNWPEMARIKELFFEDHETAMQLHVPAAEHINNHPYCLHLFRPHHEAIPRPSAEFVGSSDLTIEQVKNMPGAERLAWQRSAMASLEARS